jgi:2-iminobutanoate/2-iminopropanoate deaminase
MMTDMVRRALNPDSIAGIANRFSQGMSYGPLVFLAGMIASDFETGIDPATENPAGLPFDFDPTQAQTQAVLARQERTAKSAGTTLERAAQTWTFMTNIGDYASMQLGRADAFGSVPPATTTLGVQSLTVAGGRIEIDAIVAAPSAEREVILGGESEFLPDAFGFSRAVRVDSFIFVSSLAAVDRTGIAAMARVAPGFRFFESSVKRQTAEVLRQLKSVLDAAGSSLRHVVKVQVTLPDLRHFAEFEEVWTEAFPVDPPARSIIPGRLAVPGCLVEINAVAVVADGKVQKQIVRTDKAPLPRLHEPQAVHAGPYVFLSQLMATDWTRSIAPAADVNPQFPNHESAVRKQLEYIFANADEILDAAGSGIERIVRRQGFYTRFEGNLAAGRAITLKTFTPEPSPSTQVALGADLIVPGCKYLFDAIGVPR